VEWAGHATGGAQAGNLTTTGVSGPSASGTTDLVPQVGDAGSLDGPAIEIGAASSSSGIGARRLERQGVPFAPDDVDIVIPPGII
jgi:hypothetical protein